MPKCRYTGKLLAYFRHQLPEPESRRIIYHLSRNRCLDCAIELAECPDETTLRRLLLGQIPEPDASAIEQHIHDGCPYCAAELATQRKMIRFYRWAKKNGLTKLCSDAPPLSS